MARKLRPVWLTEAELKAALDAISNMTDGNARDFSEWHNCTQGPYQEWAALVRAETKLTAALNG